jgi:hypothetical protein
MFCDNEDFIKLGKIENFHEHNKHIEVHVHYLKQLQE